MPEDIVHGDHKSDVACENMHDNVPSPVTQIKEAGVLDIFRHSECRKDSLVMFFAWIATNLGSM